MGIKCEQEHVFDCIMIVICFFLILLVINFEMNWSELGQMICDEQYGHENSTFTGYGHDGKLRCKSLISSDKFDGGYTELVK